jgi:type III secretion system YscQ/HrcQ family protein
VGDVSTDDHATEPGSSAELAALAPTAIDTGPLGWLPRLSLYQARLETRLSRLGPGAGLGRALGWLSGSLGTDVEVGLPEVLWRPSGLRRAGLVAQLTWPRLATRLAVWVETPVAHAVVDRLLGFDRLPAEGRLPLSPVEWGVLTYVLAETLRRRTSEGPCPLGAFDPTLDRVGPDPLDTTGLGRLVTVRWPVRLGEVDGSVRLWVTESLVVRWLTAVPPPAPDLPGRFGRLRDLSGVWRAESGTIALPRGLKTLRTGGVLPLSDSRLRGTPQSPEGPVELTLRLTGFGGRFTFPAAPVPLSGGGRLTVTARLRHVPTPREALAMTPPAPPASPDPAAPASADVPVTLVVELGRVNLTLTRLADLKPGDVVELGRHSREPVELTSGGRLVARGELVLIDTELGVRVTHVFL